MVFGEFLAKSQKPLVNFFKPVINFFLTSDLFSLTTGLNHWFLGPVFSHGRTQYYITPTLDSESLQQLATKLEFAFL